MSPSAPARLPAPSPESVSLPGRRSSRTGRTLAFTIRDEELARDHVDVEPVVAVDEVDAALAEDRVVAGAAGEVVAGLAAVDQVVAGAAVRDDADRPERAGGAAGVRARVDHVVAGVG